MIKFVAISVMVLPLLQCVHQPLRSPQGAKSDGNTYQSEQIGFDDITIGYKDSPKYLDGVPANFSNKGRTQAGCPSAGSHTRVIVVIGQSQAANSPDTIQEETRYAGPIVAEITNLNPYDGRCYLAQDPLLGTTGSAGSLWLRAAHHLLKMEKAKQILLVPIAVGGSGAAEWIAGGRWRRKLQVTMRRIKDLGLAPTDIYWMQGATDAIKQTPSEVYKSYVLEIISYLRQNKVTGRFIVAQDTICSNKWLMDPTLAPNYRAEEAARQAIRRAQAELVNIHLNVVAGVDLDTWGIELRPDMCHLGAAAIEAAAAKIAEIF